MAELGSISGTTNPTIQQNYTPEANDKNTLSITSYFKLLAAQLASQDMTNPMDNSEMMAQMTQMAMVQSLSTMTNSMDTSTAVTTQTYAAGLVGQEITVAVTEENSYGQSIAVGVYYGKVESVNLTGSTPMLKLVGDDKEYPLNYVVGMGKIENPFKDEAEDGGKVETDDDGKVVEPGGDDKDVEPGDDGKDVEPGDDNKGVEPDDDE